MILTSTEVKAYLNISTSVTTYDTLINYYIPVVTDEIADISNHRYRDAYHWVWNDYLVITSSNKTFTLGDASTFSFLQEFSTGDTFDLIGSYNNDGYYTIATISSSHILTVDESIISENSTTYAIKPYMYRCKWTNDVKKIASKMIWWNVQNTTSVNGDITSESLGSYSVSYARGNTAISYGLYPSNLISGLKTKAGSY